MSNPYKNIDDYSFWSRAMTTPAPAHVDPVVRASHIGFDDKVATMGSCFAQHLARHIQRSGLNYYVAESAPDGMNDALARERNYGVFSARYGNVYTVRQAVQLFDRAFGGFEPVDDVWQRGERFVDAFRPQIEPEGWESAAAVRLAARTHLNDVRDVFARCDWFVFTLGLTEAWRSKSDGAVYPMAPGVAGGAFDAERYEFINFTAQQVTDDLVELIQRIRVVNPGVRILLTVSPVPLIATYEKRHVWVSTTYSKAALRVAADEAERRFEEVIYFPSYEIITSPAAGGKYYADDLRQVTDLGVKHVMRLFGKHFLPVGSENQVGSTPAVVSTSYLPLDEAGVVCDEEVIETALRESGFNVK